MDYTRNQYTISNDPSRLDVDEICRFLARSYWVNQRGRAVIEKSLQGSLNFGVDKGDRQIGFARVVTDRATFAYLGDVFIDEDYRGKAIGKWMMECIMAHPDLQGLRRWLLATYDAHGLYSQYGFSALSDPSVMMEIVDKTK